MYGIADKIRDFLVFDNKGHLSRPAILSGISFEPPKGFGQPLRVIPMLKMMVCSSFHGVKQV